MEDRKLMASAKNANESRNMMKNFKSRHSDLNAGEDVKNPSKIVANKAKKLQYKMQ